MREIKFRVWDKVSESMEYEIAIGKGYGEDSYILFLGLGETFIIDEDVVEIMQYIWLKDKKKKEIYNSDLLKDDKGRIFEVVLDDRFAQTGYRMLCLKNKSEKDHVKIGRCVDFYSWMVSEEENYIEVIGNKYENQNLIAEVK